MIRAHFDQVDATASRRCTPACGAGSWSSSSSLSLSTACSASGREADIFSSSCSSTGTEARREVESPAIDSDRPDNSGHLSGGIDIFDLSVAIDLFERIVDACEGPADILDRNTKRRILSDCPGIWTEQSSRCRERIPVADVIEPLSCDPLTAEHRIEFVECKHKSVTKELSSPQMLPIDYALRRTGVKIHV